MNQNHSKINTKYLKHTLRLTSGTFTPYRVLTSLRHSTSANRFHLISKAVCKHSYEPPGTEC